MRVRWRGAAKVLAVAVTTAAVMAFPGGACAGGAFRQQSGASAPSDSSAGRVVVDGYGRQVTIPARV